MVWLHGNLIALIALGLAWNPDPVENWNFAHESLQRGPVSAYFKSKSREVMNQGFFIPEDMADIWRNIPAVILERLNRPYDYPQ